MPITPTALASELNTDPAGLGYAPLIAQGNDAGCAAKLNTATATLGFRNDIAASEVIDAIPSADFATLTALQLAKLQALFIGRATIDATKPNTRASFVAIFTGLPNTIAALNTLAQRPYTRAEVLGGIGTAESASDVGFALRGSK